MNLLEFLTDRVTGKAPIGATRSPRWREFRTEFLKQHQVCALCGGHKRLIVHHIIPFWLAPTLELVKSNCVVLCQAKKKGVNCHLLFGHHGNFRKFNTEVMSDVAKWSVKIRSL